MEFPKHFKLSELLTTGTGLPNVPTWEQAENLRKLGNMLDRIRRRFGGPIAVNSAFRSEAVNKAVGGSSTSAHLKGLAADIRPVSGRQEDFKKLRTVIENLWAEASSKPVPGVISPDQFIAYRKDGTDDYRFFHVGFATERARRQILEK